MTRTLPRVASACAAALLLVAGTGSAASAAETPVTCGPAVTDGRMVAPGFWNHTGAQALISGVWTCDAHGSGAAYTISGTLTDYFMENGAYRTVRNYSQTVTAGPEVTAFTPSTVLTYAPRSNQVNTWHYVRFTASTSLGHEVDVVSQLFYVAGALQ